MQNKMVRVTLNLRGDSVRNKELLKVDALIISDGMKQLKMNHVIKIRKQTIPSYMLSHFNILNENNNRMTMRASAMESLCLELVDKELTPSLQLSKSGTP